MNTRVFIPVGKAEFYRFIATDPEGRFEYEGGRIVQQMTGGTQIHAIIARRISVSIEKQIDPSRWIVLTDRGVETDETVRFPDVVVEPADGRHSSLSALHPAVIVEVLSPSTMALDLDRKPREYMSLPSLLAYVVASQTDAACLGWLRGEGGDFPTEPKEYTRPDSIVVAKLGVTLDLAEIYRGLQFPPADGPTHA